MLSAQGTLLLRKGTVPTDERQLRALIERGAFVEEEEFQRHQPMPEEQARPEPPPKPLSGFDQWASIYRRIGVLLRQHRSEPQFVEKLAQLSNEVRTLADHDIDVAIFAMTRLDRTHYAIAHTLQVALCCDIYARFLRYDEAERSSLVKAALTMNLTILELQNTLSRQEGRPSAEQLEEIRAHPMRARDWLASAGVTDESWLRAVAEHHESSDGKGYPLGLSIVFPAAEVINIADRYCALMSHRRGREALVSNKAARDLYMLTTGHLQEIIARMIKAFGMFPPGNFVKLANGETAVVLRRSEHANKPLVASLISEVGRKLVDPVLRDTAMAEFNITHVVPESVMAVQFDRDQLFELVKQP
ncbi:MAG: HD domain-containing phosphohydrolase [Nevskia sp.]|nr:HD domain-containing phosphohydrolase [Nevskia sp.]